MTEFGKIAVASALSVLVHVSLFTVLALWPASVPTSASMEREEPPLEVALQAAPVSEAIPMPTPEPQPTQAVQPELPPPLSSDALHTQLDPEQLKKAEQAPENPTAIAAHHSRATSNPPAEIPPQPNATPMPEPGALALEPAATPLPASGGEVGIDALGNYGKAVGNAIGFRFEFYRKTEKNSLTVGEVRLKFAIDAQGSVSEVEVLSNTAGAKNAVFAGRAVKEAKIPPIPSDRLAQVPGGRIRIVYTFTIY